MLNFLKRPKSEHLFTAIVAPALWTSTMKTSICITSPEIPLLWIYLSSTSPLRWCCISTVTPLSSITSHFLPLLLSPPTVFRRLSARPPSLLLPRWKVSHPEPHPRWLCWAQAPPCWPGMEAHTWRVLRTRPQPLALPACRMTSVGSVWREILR